MGIRIKQLTEMGLEIMKHLAIKTLFMGMLALAMSFTTASADTTTETLTMAERYPNLASGVLVHAELGDLPEGRILQSGSLLLDASDLEKALEEIPQQVREEMRNNLFFLLEQKATRQLLLQEALGKDSPETQTPADTDTRIREYLEKAIGAVEATDAEVAAFYEENKDMCGGASLDQIKDDLRQYVISQKRQEAVDEHIRTMGKRREIVLSAAWVESQAALARNNPVDKARSSARPSLIDFGSTGCRPCDMMAPILETLKTKYAGKMNVEFIHVREQQILAARYGIQSIPVQILFDKGGKEVWRHTGFIPQTELEAEIAKLGLE